MHANIGNTDRTIRIVGGLLILALLYLFMPGNARWLGLLGLIPVATGFARWCPLYVPFGISSCKAPAK
jgi:hypothetical protein